MGGGNPVALQFNVKLCFTSTVTEGGGFVMKWGSSGKKCISFHSFATSIMTNKVKVKKNV